MSLAIVHECTTYSVERTVVSDTDLLEEGAAHDTVLWYPYGIVYVEAFGLVWFHLDVLWGMRLDGRMSKLGFMNAYGVGHDVELEGVFIVGGGSEWQTIQFPAGMPIRGGTRTLTMVSAIVKDGSMPNGVRGLQPISNGIYADHTVDGTDPGQWTKECELDSLIGFDAMAPAATGGVLWVFSRATGKVVPYDYVNKRVATEIDARWITPGYLAATYSKKHNVFIAVYGTNTVPYTLRVFADEPVAASMTEPAFVSAVRAGCLREVSVQVLGDHDEPCAERVVRFEADEGTFDQPNVVTDATGTATARYRAPATPANGITVTATLDE